MSKLSLRCRRICSVLAAAFVMLAVASVPAFAQLTKEETKACKKKTKTMGCTVEALTGAARANAVASGGPLPGKCQIDSPAVGSEREMFHAPGLLCDDPDIADTGDQMIALCKDASTTVRTNCRTICEKLAKIDPTTGDPIEETPCAMVVDRTVVTTKTDRIPDKDGCRAFCEASIVCVCDP